jgi:FAD/FMN-containing dehydrogenase
MVEVAHFLIDLLGPDKVSFDEDDLATHAVDALRANRGYPHTAPVVPQPLAVVRPSSTEEVSRIVRFAADNGASIVPYGGGTGLMGGAIPLRPSIIVDMANMNRIVSISSADRTATVSAGVVLADLERALNEHGLILGHDPWSLPIATVGGAISTDGLGYRAYKYGSMGDQVLGLTVVLSDGRVLKTRAVHRHSTGIDMNRLFIGGEGCFGVITEATLRVFPLPETRELLAYAFSDFEVGFEAIMDIFQAGLAPAMLELGEDSRGSSEQTILYLAYEGIREEAEAQAQRTTEILASHSAATLAHGEAQEFWDTRHRVAERFKHGRVTKLGDSLATTPSDRYFDYIHVALPASKVLQFRLACVDITSRYGLETVDYGLWCQPELFSTVVVKTNLAGLVDAEAMSQGVDEMLRLVLELGGSMEYCHGVGVRLAHLMQEEHGDVGIEVLRSLKRALDPQNILNPDKLAL